MDHPKNDRAKAILHDAILSAAADILPFSAPGARESFHPLDPIRSAEELLWTLDYIAERYHDRIPAEDWDKSDYLLLFGDEPSGHPVFLLSCLYVLLAAGKSVSACFPGCNESFDKQIINALLEQKAVKNFVLKDPYSNMETILQMRRKNLLHIVVLGGDSDWTHNHFKARLMGGSTWHLPCMHLLIADYARTPVFTQANAYFADKCYDGRLHYIAHRSPGNQAPKIALGFDFSDLLWGAEAEVNDLNDLPCIKDMIPAIIFTDRPRDAVTLPEGIDRCCDVIFFEDYDCNYPLYNFLQLLSPGQQS